MGQVDLWSEPFVPEKIPPRKDPPPASEPKKRGRPKKVVQETPKRDLSSLYVVLAGINKATERQLYLSTFVDCDDWNISVVPSVMTRERALQMIEKAEKFIEDNPKRYKHKRPIFTLESLENPEIYNQARYVIG